MLEVHDPKTCTKFLAEPPEVGGGNLDYSTERCAVDPPIKPTLATCGSRGTGTRVYDILDPLHPAEIAYWKGPAPRTAFLPGSGSWGPGADRTVEKQAGLARSVKARAADGKGHELNLWIVGDAGGSQVLRFVDDSCRRGRARRFTPRRSRTTRRSNSAAVRRGGAIRDQVTAQPSHRNGWLFDRDRRAIFLFVATMTTAGRSHAAVVPSASMVAAAWASASARY